MILSFLNTDRKCKGTHTKTVAIEGPNGKANVANPKQ